MNQQDRIDDYLLDRLSPTERALFEHELLTDTQLREELNHMQQTHELMQEAFLARQARQTIRELQKQTTPIRPHRHERPASSPAPRRLARQLAAGMVLLLTGFVTVWFNSPVQLNDIQADYTVSRSLTDDDSLANTPTRRAFSQFVEGQTRLAEGQYALATGHFETVLKTPDLRPYFREAAQWHLILAYLYGGQPARAEVLLNRFELTDSQGAYPVGWLDRWRIRWQIRWAKWTI